LSLNEKEMLRLDSIHTFYGKSHILQGISLVVRPHECIAILGRNGAGKTTTLKSIMGLTPPRDGGVFFKGQNISRLKPYEISRLGIALVPEDRQIFTTLTVNENLNISRQKDRSINGQWDMDRVYDVFPRLAERRNNRGHQLSGGEQQMLTIARALMSNPELLLLDEPSEGLAPLIVETVLNIIEEIKKEGLTIIIVEQNVEATKLVADRYYILQQGLNVFEGSHEEFWSQPKLKEDFLGV
jgi:branched-chain amino acid transport system ATP-binding protein